MRTSNIRRAAQVSGIGLGSGGFVKSPLFVAIVLVATSLGTRCGTRRLCQDEPHASRSREFCSACGSGRGQRL